MDNSETYYVEHFDRHYLNWSARRGSTIRWLCQSVNLSHPDYIALVSQPNGAAMYGVFRALLALAAKTPKPGAFVAKVGGGELRPMTFSEMASACHFVVSTLQSAVQACRRVGLFGVEATPAEAVQVLTTQRRSAQRDAQRARNHRATEALLRGEERRREEITPPNPPSRGGGKSSRAARKAKADADAVARVAEVLAQGAK